MIKIINMKSSADPEFCVLGAEEVCARLGIARQTLYAYVSRGLVRVCADPADSRRSLYDRRDVGLIESRQRRSRARTSIARSTIDWGEPIMVSSITRIADGRFYYRGKDAVTWSETATLEDTARLLIGKEFEEPASLLPSRQHVAEGAPLMRIAHVMLQLAATDWPLSPSTVLDCGAGAIAGTQDTSSALIHARLAAVWGVDAHGADLIRRALVLSADHELNASAYAVRVAASTGTSLPAAVLAGLMTLSGPLHGGQTSKARAWLDECCKGQRPAGPPPGFGHPLYPDGDIRATALLERIELPKNCTAAIAQAIAETETFPTLDIGLAGVELSLRLPMGAGLGLFALGRFCGWMAHALEQQRSGTLIRPRAFYQPHA